MQACGKVVGDSKVWSGVSKGRWIRCVQGLGQLFDSSAVPPPSALAPCAGCIAKRVATPRGGFDGL